MLPGPRTEQQGLFCDVGGWGEMLTSQRLGRESHAPAAPNLDPSHCCQVRGSHNCGSGGLGGGKATSLTLGAVTRPKQGFLILAVICGGDRQ